MDFGNGHGFGKATRNMLLNPYAKDAAYRQSPEEHDALIHKYEKPGQTPMERLLAVQRGLDEEKINPKYWDDDHPRLDLGGSSSWIDDIEYLPDLGIAVMHTDGRQYYYPMTPDDVGDWVTSDSLGSYYNANVKLKR